MNLFVKVSLSVFMLLSIAQASDEINDSLIDKLEVVYKNLAPSDPQRVVISLRLADLISEKARKIGQLEFDKMGAFGKESEALREKALKIYNSVLPNLEGSQKSRVLLQMGYLSELLQDANQAQKYFSEVAAVTSDQKVKGEAFLALAENFYRLRQYTQAIEAYQKSLGLPIERKGYAQFRLAWSYYNLGDVTRAVNEIMALLENPERLKPVQSASNSDLDIDFLNEVARDAATFLARRGKLTKAEIEKFHLLIKKGNSDEHLQHLGFEAQRLGQMQDVILIWSYFYSNQNNPILRSQAQSYLAEGYMATNQKSLVLPALKASLEEWGGVPGGCLDSVCAEIRKKNRTLIINWHKSEKLKPSAELLSCYQAFYSVHQEDFEMGEWMASLMGETGDLESSQKTYFALALSQKDSEARERLLLLALETAERSSNQELKQEARSKYLQYSLAKKQQWAVTYQYNKHFYDIKNFSEAQARLKAFALNSLPPQDLRLQSAHLYLDVLAEQQLDDMVVQAANEFSNLFAQNKMEFAKIQNKAVLNYVKKLGLDHASVALKVLEQNVQFEAFDPSDKVIYFKNKIVLYTKLKKLPEARQAIDQMFKLEKLEGSDLAWAKTQRLNLAEAAFDFDEAYLALKEVPSKTADYYLKLALFSEVTKKDDPHFYLVKAFELSKDNDIKKTLFFDILESSENPLTWIEKNLSWLQSLDTDSVGRAFVIAYKLKKDSSCIKKGLAVTAKSNSAWANLIWRYQFLSDLGRELEGLQKMSVASSSDKALQKSIKDRVATLNRVEQKAQVAVEKKDWSSQLIVLSTLATENKRFYDELMSLPIPEGFSDDESNQYMAILTARANPFLQKSTLLEEKTKALWSVAGWDQDYIETVQRRPETSELLKLELTLLERLAVDEAIKSKVSQVTKVMNSVSLSKVKSAEAFELNEKLTQLRSEVKASPSDYQKQVQLAQYERLAGNTRLADYLEARLKSLETQGGLE
jgi:hypothetical protein